jgi:hypothetical protein
MRATARGETNQRLAMLQTMLDRAHETFADRGTHRTAQERKLERARNHRLAEDRSRHHDERVFFLRGLLRLLQTVAIFLGVAKLQRILGLDVVRDLDLPFRVEERFQPIARADAHVMSALGTNMQIALELGAIQHRVAGAALHPQAFRHRARPALGLDPRRHDFLEPGHGQPPEWGRSGPWWKVGIYTWSGNSGQGGSPAAADAFKLAGSLGNCRAAA